MTLDLITRKEAAVLARVSTQTIDRWARDGLIPKFVVGPGRPRYRRSDLAALRTPDPVAESAPTVACPNCGHAVEVTTD